MEHIITPNHQRRRHVTGWGHTSSRCPWRQAASVVCDLASSERELAMGTYDFLMGISELNHYQQYIQPW